MKVEVFFPVTATLDQVNDWRKQTDRWGELKLIADGPCRFRWLLLWRNWCDCNCGQCVGGHEHCSSSVCRGGAP